MAGPAEHNEKELEAIAAARAKSIENLRTAGDLEAQLLSKVASSIDRMSPKEAAAAARDISQVKARNIEKLVSLADGGVPEQRDFGELLESMEAKGYIKVTGRPESRETSDGA